MELAKDYEEMCERVTQIVSERIKCNCTYTTWQDNDKNITNIYFNVELQEYTYFHRHNVHLRELERCIESNNGSILPIAEMIVQALKTGLINSIYREVE